MRQSRCSTKRGLRLTSYVQQRCVVPESWRDRVKSEQATLEANSGEVPAAQDRYGLDYVLGALQRLRRTSVRFSRTSVRFVHSLTPPRMLT